MRSPLLTALVAASLVCCSPPEEVASPGEAREAWCSGLYVTSKPAESGSVFYVSPETLAAAADGWGPQALAVSVDQGFATEVDYVVTPSVQKTKDEITKAVSKTLELDLVETVNLVASTSVLVPTGAYYRVEAYPEYQVQRWELRSDLCWGMPDWRVTSGAVYRPVGIHFRVLVHAGGEWNAVAPRSPSELLVAPPWSRWSDTSSGSSSSSSGGAGR